MITLYYCETDLVSDAALPALTRGLPAMMQPEVNRYHQPADRKARLLARLMLLHALESDGLPFEPSAWFTNAHSKPFIRGWKDFSITHSGSLAALACADGLVGADVEAKAGIDVDEMMHIFHPEEKRFIQEQENRQEAFYRLWSKKEALLKAAGIGLVNSLHSFSCVQNSVRFMHAGWFFYEPPLLNGYTCCICSSQCDEEIQAQAYRLPRPATVTDG